MCAKSNSNRKLLTISLVFLSCGSNAAHGWHILYQRWRNPPQDSGVDRFFFTFRFFSFLFEIFLGVIVVWFEKYPFDLDGQIGTWQFKLPSTVAESMSIVERQKSTIADCHECDFCPTEDGREWLNHQSSSVCSAQWTIPLSLHLLGRRPTVGHY